MKYTVILFLLASSTLFADESFVHHPAPKEPALVNANFYDSLKKQIPEPPKTNDKLQKEDEKELINFQKIRTKADCEQAKIEVQVNLKNFFGEPARLVSASDVEVLSSFFDQIRNDADYFIQRVKIDFPRQRPFLYMKELKPCVLKEVTGAYPSGHTAIARLYALILSDIYPKKKNQLIRTADEIGKRRIISGMHHPTDVKTGKEVGELLYKEMQKSERYKLEFNKVKLKKER